MSQDILENFKQSYPFGFVTEVESEKIPKGLTEETIRLISEKKEEPSFLLDFRLKAFRKWLKMKEPKWGKVQFSPIDFQKMTYFSQPKKRATHSNLEEVDPEVLNTFKRLGIPIEEQKRLANVAVDMVFDSVSVGITFKKKLEEMGVVLCSLGEAAIRFPELVQEYLGSVVPIGDNYYATLNAAVFTDGSFVYIPKGVKCPMELSTYFRINDHETGQFERTLIIADEESSVSYLEGCTAPAYSSNQLHAAVVELIAKRRAEIRYSTVQNWYSGDPVTGEGGVYNFVTKRGRCQGDYSRIFWTQVEVGAAITWKYPSCILQGDHTTGEFYSVALTRGKMQADTGTKMVHIGKESRSRIISKGISADGSSNTYRGLVKMGKSAKGARNFTRCDSMLIGNGSSANTMPTIEGVSDGVEVEHEASTTKINEEILFYMASRGISHEKAIQMILTGFCREVIEALPLEFSIEAKKLLSLKLEKSVG